MDSPWPMKNHDLRHTGRSPYSTADNQGVEKWRFKCNWIKGGIVIGDNGTIYFGEDGYYLYALKPDGSIKWKYKTDGDIISTPALAEDGTIYVGSLDDYLYAIYPNGTLKWKFWSHDDISSSPAIAEDGTIYFGTMLSGNNVYAINPDGTEKWKYQTGYGITSDPAIGEDGTIYIGSDDSYLYALYPNGKLRWRFKTTYYVKGSPSIADDGTIYIGSDDHLYALYPTGTMKWKCKVGVGTETNPSIGSNGTIYVGGEKLYAIYPNGTMKWSFNMGPESYVHQSSPAISSDGTVYIGVNMGDGAGGDIIAVNPDGTEKWRKTIATKWVDSSPSIGEDGTVYIGSSYDMSKGYLHAFGYVEANDPPSQPMISGTLNGKVGEEYKYTFSATDPDNNLVSFYIHWGDGTNSEWIGPYASDEKIIIEHIWDEEGTYTIQAKAKDDFGGDSNWATLEVSMPKAINSVFPRFLEQYPRLFPIIGYLMDLLRLPLN